MLSNFAIFGVTQNIMQFANNRAYNPFIQFRGDFFANSFSPLTIEPSKITKIFDL